MIETRCAECGEAFSVAPSRLKFGRGHYCSRHCQYAANSKRLTKERVCYTCVGCGVQFLKLESYSRGRKGSGKYCSRPCRDKNWHGERNPLWQGAAETKNYGVHWQAAKRFIRKRDKTCQHCGSSDNLHVHHIHPIRFFDDPDQANHPDNLVLLCGSCHRTEEAKWRWVAFDGGASFLRFNAGGYALELAKAAGLPPYASRAEDARHRLAHTSGADAPLFADKAEPAQQLGLFGEAAE